MHQMVQFVSNGEVQHMNDQPLFTSTIQAWLFLCLDTLHILHTDDNEDAKIIPAATAEKWRKCVDA